MKLRRIVVGIASIIAMHGAMAQIEVKSSDAIGYLSRGVQMYDAGNYNGAIDQLCHLQNMLLSESEKEQADLYRAKSYLMKGESAKALRLLSQYVLDFPSSFNLPEVYATVGDLYFYNGRYGLAIANYQRVNSEALTTSQQADVTYRLAYSKLRLKKGDSVNKKTLTDKDVTTFRQEALSHFESLSAIPQYSDAAQFYRAYSDYENKDYDNALEKFEAIKSENELGNASKYYMTQIHYMKGNDDKALEIGQSLLSNSESNNMTGEVKRIVGQLYYFDNDDTNAAKYLNEYITQTESNPLVSAQFTLGILSYRNADYDKAIELLGAAAKTDHSLGQCANYYLGQCHRAQNNLSLAAMAYEKAATQDFSKSTKEAAAYNYAVVQNEGGRTPFSKAIDMFEAFLTEFPNSQYADAVSEYMAVLYVNGNDYNKALASISRIKSPSDKVLAAKQVVLYNLGVNALSNDRPEEAQKHLLEARKLAKYDRKLDAQNSLWLGECAYRTENFEKAAQYQNEYLKAVNSSDNNYGLGYYNLGYSRFQQKNHSAARSAFNKAIESKQLNESLVNDAQNRIGDTYYYEKNFKAAQKCYEKSSGDYAIYQKGIMLGLSKDYSGKVAQMKKMRTQYPTSALVPKALLEEADAYVSMNNNKKAITIYDELIAQYPDNAYARKGMLSKAITERNAGNEANAIATYKNIIKSYPTSEEASLALEDLKLIYAANDNMDELSEFLSAVQNAPQLDVNDIDRLTFEAAEKAYIADNNNISKMENYLEKNPNGAYSTNAKYYTAKYNYNKGNETDALELIEEVESEGKDASFLEDALAMKASILSNQGKYSEAQEAYTKLATKATNADNRITAQLGIMRTSAQLNDYNNVVTSANQLLKDGGLTSEEEKEVTFNRGFAYYKQGKNDSATNDFALLATDVRNVYGAQSAFYIAEIQYNDGKFSDAENSLNTFIDAGTPHEYWLARAFILLADVYHKQGNTLDACQYLESLKSNYPGNEQDIPQMIDSRLKSWGSNSNQK